jgi:small subunit ribosomal protein S6
MKKYELMAIIDTTSEAEKIDRTVTRIEEIIAGKKGKVLSIDRWGKRRLAYEIQRRQYGYYTLFTFEVEPSEVVDINRLLRLNPMVLRHLLLLVNPKAAAKPYVPPEEEEAKREKREEEHAKERDLGSKAVAEESEPVEEAAAPVEESKEPPVEEAPPKEEEAERTPAKEMPPEEPNKSEEGETPGTPEEEEKS